MPARLTDFLRRHGLGILAHVAVFAAWYLWVVPDEVPAYVMPTPLATIQALWDDYDWVHNTLVTAGEVFFGYLAAVIFGVLCALVFSWSRLLNATFMPLIVSTNMIPKVALGPPQQGENGLRVAKGQLDTAGLAPGEYTLEVTVKGDPSMSSRMRFVVG